MNTWLQQLKSLLGQSTSPLSSQPVAGGGPEGIAQLLVPGALGGLAGILLASKSSRKLLTKYGTSALLVGGSAEAGRVLWDQYKTAVRQIQPVAADWCEPHSSVDVRTERLITAFVFAAKSDGHIDAKERQFIAQQLREVGIDGEGKTLVEQAIDRPLDPHQLAQGVRNEEEALELYYLSCMAIDIDHFMERSYLNALGDALNIPQDVRSGIEHDIQQQKQPLPV